MYLDFSVHLFCFSTDLLTVGGNLTEERRQKIISQFWVSKLVSLTSCLYLSKSQEVYKTFLWPITCTICPRCSSYSSLPVLQHLVSPGSESQVCGSTEVVISRWEQICVLVEMHDCDHRQHKNTVYVICFRHQLTEAQLFIFWHLLCENVNLYNRLCLISLLF